MTSRRYTAGQAGYQPKTQVVVLDNGLPKHFVMTRHGAVRRTWLDPVAETEVALWRPSLRYPQYQGSVTWRDGTYVAADPAGREVARAGNYLDAEAALLPLRNRHRSESAREKWPDAILRELWRRRDSRSLPAGNGTESWCRGGGTDAHAARPMTPRPTAAELASQGQAPTSAPGTRTLPSRRADVSPHAPAKRARSR